jgi:signal transduction histidine kinase
VSIDEDEYQNSLLQISVIDTGIGIAHEDQDKLFKLFGFVKDTRELNTHGIGLGLVISEQIVQQFRGKISFESEPNHGSTFTFSFMLDHKVQEEIITDKQFMPDTCDLQFKWKPNSGVEVQYVN